MEGKYFLTPGPLLVSIHSFSWSQTFYSPSLSPVKREFTFGLGLGTVSAQHSDKLTQKSGSLSNQILRVGSGCWTAGDAKQVPIQPETVLMGSVMSYSLCSLMKGHMLPGDHGRQKVGVSWDGVFVHSPVSSVFSICLCSCPQPPPWGALAPTALIFDGQLEVTAKPKWPVH